jgi:quinoprotein glucose dehydrogenase
MLFVLDRETGQPIIPVEERAVPRSTVAGEVASPTQPFSTIPPLSRHRFDRDSTFGADSADRADCRAIVSRLRYDGPFTPPSLEGTLAIPSNVGGAHWGGVAFDPTRQLAIVPVNDIAAVVQLIPRAQHDGKMEEGWEYAAMRGTPYLMRRRILLSPAGVPCTPPPFGALVAVDVRAGTIAWRVPLGTPGSLVPNRMTSAGGAVSRSALSQALRATAPVGADSAALRALGSVNLGGPIVTAGGLAFIGATLDHQVRAFDVETGRELWRAGLPAAGKATPMTYAVNGRQYVAIAAGGDGSVFGTGDEVVVFALPAR